MLIFGAKLTYLELFHSTVYEYKTIPWIRKAKRTVLQEIDQKNKITRALQNPNPKLKPQKVEGRKIAVPKIQPVATIH